MDRRPSFDLGYTHEIARLQRTACDSVPSQPRDLDLTMRLRCLKALYDSERERRAAATLPLQH